MPNQFSCTRRIEFADTDMAGIVHFSRFFVFMEAAEHEFLRSLGLSVHLEHEGHIISWPRLAAACDYRRPVRFEDQLDIHLRIERLGTKSITYAADFSHSGEVVADGTLTAACCLCDPGQPLRAIPIPDFIRASFASP
jgi:acyl-CoA thioester hydrolase